MPSERQQAVTLSSCDAEHHGLVASAHELQFLRQLLCDLQHPQQQPPSFIEDIVNAIQQSTALVFQKRSKRIDVKQHSLSDTVPRDEINIQLAPIQNMAADSFTKDDHVANFTENRKTLWAD